MLGNGEINSVTVIAPHADDEALGPGGLIAACRQRNIQVNVLFLAVDASTHYGLSGATTLQMRLDEVANASEILGYDYEIAYPGQGLLEKLDTVPRRELVDLFETRLDAWSPDLLLLPHGEDYDQDHIACFQAAHAATRPMPASVGKHFVPKVVTYETAKLQWAERPFKATAFFAIDTYLNTKLRGIEAHASQVRELPHVRSEENIVSLARLRGSEVGMRYAEAYRIMRWVITQ